MAEEKKEKKPAPPSAELVSMLERFQRCNGFEEMIEVFNKNARGWTPYMHRVAKNAIAMIMRGEVPKKEVVDPERAMIDAAIEANIAAKKKTPTVEQELRQEFDLPKKLFVKEGVYSSVAPVKEEIPVMIPDLDEGSKESPKVKDVVTDELPVSRVTTVEGRKDSVPGALKNRIPKNMKK